MSKKPTTKRPVREDLITSACLQAYGAIRHEGRLADRALEYVLRGQRHLYSEERRTVADRVYSLLRHQRLIDHLLGRVVRNVETHQTTRRDIFRISALRVLEGETPSVVVQAMGLVGTDVAWLRELLAVRQRLPQELKPLERIAIEASLPDFLAERLLSEMGEEALSAAEAMNKRAPLTVRVNTLKTSREELMARLTREDVVARPTPLSPFGLHLETRLNAYGLASFREGLFEIQDEGSQLLGMLVDAMPTKVVDACAGAGGKTLQLAPQMKNRGDLYALDVEQRRLDDLKKRARRAGVHNVRILAIPKGPEAVEALASLHHKADRVLVDAPCSGSGTFRRKPDARYRLDEKTLAEHVARQRELLARFSVLTKPGGRLIYGTCSLLREENEAIVENFLETHGDFRLMPCGPILGEGLAEKVARDGMLRLYPHRHNTDGFFGAVLVREKAK
jgi:16S rRNA (cytosine967-C5)-methyltransferase